jgi:hypothetical protein
VDILPYFDTLFSFEVAFGQFFTIPTSFVHLPIAVKTCLDDNQ